MAEFNKIGTLSRPQYLLALLLLVLSAGFSAAQYIIPDPAFRQFLQKKYPAVIESSTGALNQKSASVIQGTLDCSGQNIKDLSGIEYFTSISRLICKNNLLKEMPAMPNLNLLTAIDCSYNQLTAIPQLGLSTSATGKLRLLNFAYNQISEITPFKTDIRVDSLVCEGNRLTFDDLLYLKKFSEKLLSAPQLPSQVAALVELNEGERFTFPYPGDDTVHTNAYIVYKDSRVVLATAGLWTKVTFGIDSVTTKDAGWYHFEVRNPYLPGVILSTSALKLEVKPLTPENIVKNIFTPDGDMVNDTYYLPGTGIIRIYNKSGHPIKELQGPAHWDGTDQQGHLAPLGTYIIRYVTDATEEIVTLVR